jgi:SAM-dependent methyltransferase
MKTLPNKKFNFVLLLSALHYIDEPAQLLRAIRDVLTTSGVLILETGLAAGKGGKTVSRALRSIDERFFPTVELLKQVWLRDYSIREMGHSVAQVGDPLPRYVFHCTPTKTNVLFIVGVGGIGKSSLAAQFTNSPVISTDELFAPDRFSQPKLHPAQRRYDEVFAETKSIWATWERINGEAGVRDYFATATATAIKHCAGAGSVVVEGFVLRNITAEIKTKLGPDYQCWSTSRV